MDKKELAKQKKVEAAIVKMMNEDPAKMTQFMILQTGKMCHAAAVETMTITQEYDHEGKRYEVKCEITVKNISRIIQLGPQDN